MSYPMPIVDMFAEVVEATKNSILTTLQDADPNIETINYMYGHPVEIMQTLADMERDTEYRAKKFPVIILFQDFNENRGNNAGNYATVSLNIAIAFSTQPSLISSERYTQVFKPILYQLYHEFMKQVANYDGFNISRTVTKLEHTKIDRVFWGKNGLYGNDGNKFADYLDAIEIQNLNLTIKNKIC